VNGVTVNLDVNGLLEALKQLGIQVADASTPYIAHLYEIYVRQQVIYGWLYIIGAAIMLVLTAAWTVFSVKVVMEDTDAAPLFLLSLAGTGIGIGLIFSGITKLLNPEYYALQALIAALTGVAK